MSCARPVQFPSGPDTHVQTSVRVLPPPPMCVTQWPFILSSPKFQAFGIQLVNLILQIPPQVPLLQASTSIAKLHSFILDTVSTFILYLHKSYQRGTESCVYSNNKTIHSVTALALIVFPCCFESNLQHKIPRAGLQNCLWKVLWLLMVLCK